MKAVQIVATAACTVLLVSAAVKAEPYYDKGLELYKKGDYKQAVAYFEQAVKNAPDDANALYYDALCWHQMKNWTRAAACYKQIVQKFPDSQAAVRAHAVLKTLDPVFERNSSAAKPAGGTAGGDSSIDMFKQLQAMMKGQQADLSRCPKQSKVYYTQHEYSRGIAFLVDAQIDGRPIKMCFDTGASVIALGKNHLAQLGLPPIPATQPPDAQVSGVGSNSSMDAWIVRHNIKVGGMEIPNCPIFVQENLPTDPLLGQSFINQFAYTIDYGAHAITFVRKDAYDAQTANAGPAGAYDVPFTKEGNELVVNATVNGKKCQMYFDTGAMQVVFPTDIAAKLGIDIPDDAQQAYSMGVGGRTKSWLFPVRDIKVGPVEKRDLQIAVVESAKMGKPLLGQPFYAGWQYTIDNANSVIHFVRR